MNKKYALKLLLFQNRYLQMKRALSVTSVAINRKNVCKSNNNYVESPQTWPCACIIMYANDTLHGAYCILL